MQDTTKIKRRRLDAEIENLEGLVRNTKLMIKYDPYAEDMPSLKKQLAQAQEDLASAKKDLIAHLKKHHTDAGCGFTDFSTCEPCKDCKTIAKLAGV